MAGNLSQKERTILQDQLRHEEVCINKYRDYAKRTSDSTLRGLFNEFAQDEQEHHNTLNGMLGGSQGQSQQAGAANAGQSRSDEEFIRAAAEERLQFRGIGQAQQPVQGQSRSQGQSQHAGQPTQSQWLREQQQSQQQGQQQGQQQTQLQQAQQQQAQRQQSQSQGQQSQSSSNWPGTLQEASRELIPMFRTEMAQEFAGGTGMGESDASIVRDMLMTEQFVSGSYDSAIFDSVSQNVRQTLQHIQKDEQKHGQGLRDYMQRRGLGQQ